MWQATQLQANTQDYITVYRLAEAFCAPPIPQPKMFLSEHAFGLCTPINSACGEHPHTTPPAFPISVLLPNAGYNSLESPFIYASVEKDIALVEISSLIDSETARSRQQLGE